MKTWLHYKYVQTICIVYIFCFGINISAQQVDSLQSTTLLPDSATMLNTVNVESYLASSKLLKLSGNLSVVFANDIRFSDATNLATILNTLPGVSMQSGTYATNRIVIRGMGSRTPYNTNRIRAYLNDIPITTSDGISNPEEMDIHSIGRYEILKGPTSALYGSGLGGSINLYTPRKNKNEWSAGIQTGSFNTTQARFSGTLNTDKSNLFASISQFYSDGYRQNSQFRRTSLLSAFNTTMQGLKINVTLFLLGSRGEIPSSIGYTLFKANPRAAAPNWAAIEGFKKNAKGIIGLDFVYGFRPGFENKLTVFGKFSDNYEKRPFNNLDDETFSLGFRNKLTFRTQKADWITGLEYVSESYAWTIDRDNALLNKNLENRNHFNLFSLGNYRPNQNWNISLAGSVNYIMYRLKDLHLANGDQAGKRSFPLIFSPRIGVNYSPNHLFSIYASAGHGYSLPSPEETLLPQGEINEGILPEQGYQFETGTRIALFNKTMDVDISVYWIELNNLLLTKRLSEDIFTGINAGKSRHQGIELLMINRFFHSNSFPGRLSSTFSFTKSINRFIDFIDDGNSYNFNDLPGIPNLTANFLLKWEPIGRIETFAHVQYIGKQFINDLNSIDYPGYFLVNFKASLNIALKKNVSLSILVGINNLADKEHASMLLVNAIGIGNQ
jgi:iron complex outermembrane recepter protein